MGYKIKGAFKRSKPVLIVIIILWIALSIVFIAPISISIVDCTVDGKVVTDDFVNTVFERLSSIGDNLKLIFSIKYISAFGKGELYLGIILILIALVGFIKSMPKNEYTDIEHGSSDWATNGEQYQVLSPKKGIILAEKNYLPVDKRGNVNVLVVGRFRLW